MFGLQAGGTYMIPKNLDDITREDIQLLIENKVQESRFIEYKRDFDISQGDKKKEFLADVSAFANASGGDLIFGISEDKETGLPLETLGVSIENPDEDLRRIENLIRDGISPRLPSVNIRTIEVDNSKSVIVIRIKKSWLSPHRVIYGGHDKFYSRNSKEKYPLDVSELRTAFYTSETVKDKIKRFIEERISRINIGDTPIDLDKNPRVVLHLVPFISFDTSYSYNLSLLTNEAKKTSPIYCSGWNNKINFDGHLSYSVDNNGCSYTQFYKTGIIEAVNTFLLRPFDKKVIPSLAYERELIISVKQYINYLKNINVDMPIAVFLSLINVKDYIMAVDTSRFFSFGTYPIDRDILITPEVIIDDYNISAEKILKPCFDSIWNACGWERSMNYDKDGDWNV